MATATNPTAPGVAVAEGKRFCITVWSRSSEYRPTKARFATVADALAAAAKAEGSRNDGRLVFVDYAPEATAAVAANYARSLRLLRNVTPA